MSAFKKSSSKYRELADLLKVRNQWKSEGLVCVFTNGCFDILHEGHVRYLEEARMLGDKLIIGLNSDKSVRKLKGPTRPINLQDSRALVLAALQAVDAVVVFDTETPEDIIKLLNPDVLVKGGDWKVDQIIGADHVLKNGGKVYSLSFHKGFSTSLIVEKVKAD
ncbi:MAG: D-glycero-beta-D-manno-heptose 1-phosphate adenylyltransferase [Saprospiraceae bacterium]|nr:D-glycero-beta-D-manno-heptose 1-phosphate adenylyltransferase [Saprospiraceae bacterium]